MKPSNVNRCLDAITIKDSLGKEIAPMTLLGNHYGEFHRGCFSASIILSCGHRLIWKDVDNVPRELTTKMLGEIVPVTVKVSLNELGQIVIDAERTAGLGTANNKENE